jgi:outer membrane protein TolC
MRTVILIGLLLASGAVTRADLVEQQVRARQQARLEQRDRVLSLEDCIKIALEHNLDVQITRLSPEVAGFDLRASYAGYDPEFSLSGKHSYALSPGGFDTQGRSYTGTESETDSYAGSIGGLLPWGTLYSFGANLSDRTGTTPGTMTDTSTYTLDTNTIYNINTGLPVGYLVGTNYGTLPTRNPFENASANVGFFELRQPLLKDFWIDNTRLQIFLSKKSLQRSEYELRRIVIKTITDVEVAYYNFIYTDEAVKVQEKALELAERLVAENRRRVEVGALAPLDEKQAESEAASRRADLLDAQASRGTQERVLKQLLSDDYTDWQGADIHPTETLQAKAQGFNLQESWRKGMAERPDLRQARIDVEMQERRVKYQRNQRFPQLDLVGDVGYTGSDDRLGSAWSQVRRTENSYYSYGVQLTVPLGNVGGRNNYKSAKTTQEQRELQLQQLEQDVLIEIENNIAVARTSLERVDATRQARAYAEDALKAEEMKLEKGKSTSFIVLDLQSKLTAARSAEIKALADYNIALAKLAESEGSTLERRGVELSVK